MDSSYFISTIDLMIFDNNFAHFFYTQSLWLYTWLCQLSSTIIIHICPSLPQITTLILGRAFISLFFATRLLIWLSCIIRVLRCLFRIRTPVTSSQHLSVSLLFDITNRLISVSASALQISTTPLSVILLFPRSRLSTPSLACCFRS